MYDTILSTTRVYKIQHYGNMTVEQTVYYKTNKKLNFCEKGEYVHK